MPRDRPPVHPAQRRFARYLRDRQTDCETLLWQQLRNRRLHGLKFRRQHPWPPYVLDFYCVALRLAVELDGGQHFSVEGLRHDQLRSDYLRAQGIRLIRFSNLEVLQALPDVLAEILRQALGPSPSP